MPGFVRRQHRAVSKQIYKLTTLHRSNIVYLQHGGGNYLDWMTSLSPHLL